MIPVHIDLHTIYRPEHDLIKKQLRADGFSNVKIQEMLQNRQFLLICDGYNECGIATNLHTTNKLNRTGQRNVKMVVSCRTTLFSRGYQGLFHPHGADKYHDTYSHLFEEATIVPFTEDDVKAYIHQYICDTAMQDLANDLPRWTVEQFMDTFSTITGLSGLVKNPFVLSLALRVLPSLLCDALASTAINRTTRAQLLDRFFENWVGVNESRIRRMNKLKTKVFTVFQDLCDSEGGFKGCVTDFLTNLSAAMFEHQGYSSVVNYEHVKEEITWKGEFFGRTTTSTLLRDASPLNRAGDQYRFIHDTFFDYFRSLAFYTPDQGEDDGSDDGEDNDSDDSQSDDSNSSDGDETNDDNEDDSDSSEMNDSGEGAGDNEGDGGGILGPSDLFFIGLTGEGGGPPSGKYCSSGGNGGSFGGNGDRSGGNSDSTNSGDGSSDGDGNRSGGNGDANNSERGSNRIFSGSSGGSGGFGGNDNNSNGGKDGSKQDKNSPRKGKDVSRSKKKGRPTKSRSSTSIDPFSRQNVFKDPHVLELLVDRVHSDPRFEKRLFVNIEQSKLSPVPSLAAANSITILYMAGKRFRDIDLDGVKIPYDYMPDGGHGTPKSGRSLSNALMALSSSRSMQDYSRAQFYLVETKHHTFPNHSAMVRHTKNLGPIRIAWGYDDGLKGYFFTVYDDCLRWQEGQSSEVDKITEKVSMDGGGNYFDLNTYRAGGFGHRVSEKTMFTFMRRYGINPDEIKSSDGGMGGGAEEVKECAHSGCGTPETVLKRCAKCKNVWYCSKKCQTADWSSHKLICTEA